ncbi:MULTISPECIES: MalY/PatB family protein [Pseudomonas]|uniref:MalY/PatB family protein n=1 Tax=Pseudomonas TaxID=286 RepID=UPI0039901CCA
MTELRPITRQAENTLALAKYPEAQPHWVADMAFATPDAIISAVRKRIEEGHFSYPNIPYSVYESIQHWCKNQYDWSIQKEWIVIVPNTISGVRTAIKSTCPQGTVMLQSPNYNKLLNLSKGFHLTPYTIELTDNGRPFTLSDLRHIKQTNPSAIVLCNPTNPTGIVSIQEELESLALSIKDLDTIVISDEAHADIILGQRRHLPAGSIKGLENKSITLLSPSKTFNLAGISIAYAVIPCPKIRDKFKETQTFYASGINALGLVALESAYFNCSDWLQALLQQLKSNQKVLHTTLRHTSLKYKPSEATYLAWIDTRETDGHVFDKLLQAGIAVSNGEEFGSPGWIRFNFACPQDQLTTATCTFLDLFRNIK